MNRPDAPVAVIAGTRYDARLGADLLRARGVAAEPHPMAGDPDEQDAAQYFGAGALDARFQARLRDLASAGTSLAMLFCNSLAAVVDLDTAAASPVRVVSPTDVYRRLPPVHRQILAYTGNGQALVGLERVLLQGNPDRQVLGISDPALVRDIEAGDPARAYSRSRMRATLAAARERGVDAVLLACTHFTAVLPFIEADCDIPVVDVGLEMVEMTGAVAGGPATAPSWDLGGPAHARR